MDATAAADADAVPQDMDRAADLNKNAAEGA